MAAYRENPNGTRAAKEAGYRSSSAAVTACRLMKDPKIRSALQIDAPAVKKPARAAAPAPAKPPRFAESAPPRVEPWPSAHAPEPAIPDAQIMGEAAIPESPAVPGPERTPLEYMLWVMNDVSADEQRRDRMATAAAPYVHGKIGEGGKKDQRQDAAKRAAGGKFGTPAAPKLTLVR